MPSSSDSVAGSSSGSVLGSSSGVGPGPGSAPTSADEQVAREFTAMAASLGPDLERFIVRLLHGDAHRARDLVQDTLLSAWRHLPELRRPELLRSWIYRVAYRHTMSSLRRRGPRGRPILALDIGPASQIENRPVREGPRYRVAGDWADSEDMTPRLASMLAELPPRFEMPLRLHYLESLNLLETARLLGLRVPTLKMRLHRARELLRRRLTQAADARRFRRAPGHRGAPIGRPPPPATHPSPAAAASGPPPPAPPTPPTPGIASPAPSGATQTVGETSPVRDGEGGAA